MSVSLETINPLKNNKIVNFKKRRLMLILKKYIKSDRQQILLKLFDTSAY